MNLFYNLNATDDKPASLRTQIETIGPQMHKMFENEVTLLSVLALPCQFSKDPGLFEKALADYQTTSMKFCKDMPSVVRPLLHNAIKSLMKYNMQKNRSSGKEESGKTSSGNSDQHSNFDGSYKDICQLKEQFLNLMDQMQKVDDKEGVQILSYEKPLELIEAIKNFSTTFEAWIEKIQKAVDLLQKKQYDSNAFDQLAKTRNPAAES
ncbi:MAG: hypothetical protein H6850_02885 [Alphaproteobacteria bacterium]|nr:MAG: hypothetical protein H6850_02885 [Alphaproteobacteria bacterium]